MEILSLRVRNYFLDFFLAFSWFQFGILPIWREGTTIIGSTSPNNAILTLKSSPDRSPSPSTSPTPGPCASKPGAFVGLETSNLPRPIDFHVDL